MIVEFSDIALAGLKRAFSEEDIREDYKLAISFFLKARDAERRAHILSVFPDKQMYLRELDNIAIMYELVSPGKPIMVWSIRLLSGKNSVGV